MLLKRENAKTLKEIPAEIRYAYYDEQRKKYLKEHFYIKKVKVGYTEEEQEEMRQRLHKELAKRKRQGKKVRIQKYILIFMQLISKKFQNYYIQYID